MWRPSHTRLTLTMVGIFPIRPGDSENVETYRLKFIDPATVSAFFMAVNAINDNTSILADFRIHPIALNGGCDPDLVMRQFIEILQRGSSMGFISNIVSVMCRKKKKLVFVCLYW